MSADMKWADVQKTRQLNKLEQALGGGYLAPTSSSRLSNAVVLLEESKLPQYAIKYARAGVAKNKNYFDAWKVLYYIQKSTPEDKALAKSNLERLDPKNTNIFELPK
jgi:hypothetical protein